VKFTRWDVLHDAGGYSASREFQRIRDDLVDAISRTVWPPGSPSFTVYPESGKKTGKGNGVKPIKVGFTSALVEHGWTLEKRAPRQIATEPNAVLKGSQPGAFDCHLSFPADVPQPFVVEWETGNISSSHRAINRIGLGMLRSYVSGGILIVPSSRLAPFLTDRIGNEGELQPYRELWKDWSFVKYGYFAIVSVEHDHESFDVPRIPKGTDGRAQA